MYCEYSTGSGIDRKNRRMRGVERVVDWFLVLFRWLIATPGRAALVLKAGWTVVADNVVARAAAGWQGRRLKRGSRALELPHLRSIGWMTYCLGQGWTSAPPGLLPALVSRAPSGIRGHTTGFMGTPLFSWEHFRGSVRRFVPHGAPGSIRNDHFLFCSKCVRGFTAAALGVLGYLTDFSMPAYAAGL